MSGMIVTTWPELASNTGTRSRKGCWTCKARRKKCDEQRPVCGPCSEKLLRCGGYERRLKWHNKVHLRGSETNLHKAMNELQICANKASIQPSLCGRIAEVSTRMFKSQLDMQLMHDCELITPLQTFHFWLMMCFSRVMGLFFHGLECGTPRLVHFEDFGRLWRVTISASNLPRISAHAPSSVRRAL